MKYMVTYGNKRRIVRARSVEDAVRRARFADDTVKDDVESEFDKYRKSGKFTNYQLSIIRIGLKENLDVSKYADPKYDARQMEQILDGLSKHLDVSKYANPKFDNWQMDEIREGLLNHIDISKYADPKFNYQQMSEIRYGLENHVDVSKYADPKYTHQQMKTIREQLERGTYKDSRVKDSYYNHSPETIKNYLKEKIAEWYRDASMDYGVEGKLKSIQISDTSLTIIVDEKRPGENTETLVCTILYPNEFSLEDLYNIWMANPNN